MGQMRNVEPVPGLRLPLWCRGYRAMQQRWVTKSGHRSKRLRFTECSRLAGEIREAFKQPGHLCLPQAQAGDSMQRMGGIERIEVRRSGLESKSGFREFGPKEFRMNPGR